MVQRLLLICVLVSTLPLCGQEQRPKSSKAQQPSTATAEQGDTRSVITINSGDSEPQKEQNGDSPKKRTPNYLSRLFSPENIPTIAVVIVGVITFRAIWIQAIETRRTANAAINANSNAERANADTLAAIKRQADLMERQANLMAGQMTQTSRHLNLIERPWISISMRSIGPITFDDLGMSVTFVLGLSNPGKSPARIVAVMPRIILLQDGMVIEKHRNQFIELCKRGAQPGPFEIIFPGESRDSPQSFIVRRTELHTMTDGLLYPYLFVGVSYHTTIDPNERPFSLYTYLIRKGVSGERETVGFPPDEVVPYGLVHITQDSRQFGPIAE